MSHDVNGVRAGRFVVAAGPRREVVHAHAGLALHLTGAGVVHQGGTWPLAAGDLRLVPAGVPHAAAGGGGDAIGVGFSPAGARAVGLGDLLGPFDAVRSGAAPVLRPPPAVADKLHAVLGLLAEEEQPRSRWALLQVVLVEVVRLAVDQRRPAGAVDGAVAQVLAWLEVHAFGPVTLRDVARAVRRSPSHLTTEVRRQTGRTVGQWIVALRVAEARRRLAETDELVDVIGERVGYPDPSHFARVFRRETGRSPTAYRAAAVTSAGSPRPSGRG